MQSQYRQRRLFRGEGSLQYLQGWTDGGRLAKMRDLRDVTDDIVKEARREAVGHFDEDSDDYDGVGTVCPRHRRRRAATETGFSYVTARTRHFRVAS